MKIHRHKVNYRIARESRQHPYNVGRFLTIWKGDPEKGPEHQIFGGHTQLIFSKLIPEFSISLTVGNSGSETPWDGHLILPFMKFYWGIENGRKLADWLTSRKQKWSHRELSLNIRNGSVYACLWVDQNAILRDKWRRPDFPIDPRVWLWGRKRYYYTEIFTTKTTLRMPEAEYPAHLTLQESVLKRIRGKRIIKREFVIDIDIPKGIPSHVDHSGGYKGDRTYGFGVNLPVSWPAPTRDWVLRARQLAEARVLEMRGNAGFVKPDEEE